MVRFGPKLERKQMVLFRAVDIGAELFAMSATCSRAQMLAKQGRKEAISLADAFCIEARERIRIHFDQLFGVDDAALYKLSQEVLRGDHAWLEQGIVSSVAQIDRGRRRASGGPAVAPAPAGSSPTTAKVGVTQ
jgi:hypothetical protein